MTILLAALSAASLAATPAEALVNAKDSLGPLNGFTVAVDLDDRARLARIDGPTVEAQIDAALRRSNVHVYRYSGTRRLNPPGTPGEEGQLRFEVIVLKGTTGDDPLAVARYDLTVAQWARPEADDTATTLARTWSDGGVVTAPASKIAPMLRDALAASLDKFCSDYASARAYWLARQRAAAAEGPSR